MFSEGLRLSSSFDGIWSALGQSLLQGERLDEAGSALEKAVEVAPRDSWSRFLLGRLCEKRDDLRAAEKQYQHAVELAPPVGLFWASLADVTARLGYGDRADGLFREALAHDTNDYLTNRAYGLFLFDRGLRSKARFYLERAQSTGSRDGRIEAALNAITEGQ